MVNYSYHKYVSDEVFISLILILFFQESLNRQSKSSFLFLLGVQEKPHLSGFFCVHARREVKIIYFRSRQKCHKYIVLARLI